MLFNSLEFTIFLPLVFFLYWFVTNKSLKSQNLLILIVSYVFYGWWDWRFLSLIAFSSLVDFLVGIQMTKTSKPLSRKLLLALSIGVNLSFLGFFKYFNFFAESFSDAFTLFGNSFDPVQLKIVLPVGISFYTFQTLSYSLDVYNRKLKATHDPITFFAFVSFFPQLVAGPIERATNLLPQFYKKRKFDLNLATDGMRQILWGFFKKVVIADNCAAYVNDIYQDPSMHSASTLWLAAILFSFQIYCDFSGYSDIAIGVSRLFGFSLMKNFSFPYFSRDIGEFWRRWHISLSTWFRDYLYLPLGGSRGSIWLKIRNTMIIFVVSGFWHGANWTFIAWGFINALYFLPLLLLKKNKQNQDTVAQGRIFPNFKEALQIMTTFVMTTLAWVLFRSESITGAYNYFLGMFTGKLIALPHKLPATLLVMITILICTEWLQRHKSHALEINGIFSSRIVRWSIYVGIILLISIFKGSQQEFIYFQF